MPVDWMVTKARARSGPPGVDQNWAISLARSAAVLSSLIVYAAVYFFIFGFGIWYLRKLLLVGPVKQPPKHLDGGEKTPARPLSLPDEPVEGG